MSVFTEIFKNRLKFIHKLLIYQTYIYFLATISYIIYANEIFRIYKKLDSIHAFTLQKFPSVLYPQQANNFALYFHK